MGEAAVVRVVACHKEMPSLHCQYELKIFCEEAAFVVVDNDYINAHEDSQEC